MLHSKFIVENGDIIIGKVEFHKELVTDKSKVRGGGLFQLSDDKKTILFFGKSFDFGEPHEEELIEAVKNKRVFANPLRIHHITDKHKFIWQNVYGERIELN